jgi:hypothetical protein
MDAIATIMGYVLFVISEILPLLPIPTSGVFHTLVLGIGNAFKSPEKDIELAKSLVGDPSLANVVNTLSTNSQLKGLVDSLVADPSSLNIITHVNNNATLINNINNNPNLLNIVNKLVSDTILTSQINTILNQDPSVIPIVESNLSIISSLNAQIASNLLQLINSPHLSSTINNMVHLSNTDMNNVLNIIDHLNTNPSKITPLLQQVN